MCVLDATAGTTNPGHESGGDMILKTGISIGGCLVLVEVPDSMEYPLAKHTAEGVAEFLFTCVSKAYADMPIVRVSNGEKPTQETTQCSQSI